MAIIASERPGVFSSFETSTITYGGQSGGAVGLVAACKGCEVGRVYSVTRMSTANLYFGEMEEASPMIALCEILLLNGASEIKAVAVDSDTSYEQAFALLEGDPAVVTVVCDSTDEQVHKTMLESITRASKNKRERIGVAFAGTGAANRAKELNSERLVLTAQNGLDENGQVLSGVFLAAALAAKASMAGASEQNFNGLGISGIPALEGLLTEEEIDDLIRAGVTPFETLSGGVEIIRAVTTRSTSNGIPDRTYRDLSTVLVIDNVITGVREALRICLPGARNNQRTRTAIVTQAAIELSKRQETGLLDGYEMPRIFPDPEDAGICIVELAFTVARGINQIHITAHIRV